MNPEYPLLDHVGGHERSFLATFFYRAVRDDGATTPVEVIRAVRRRLDQRMSHPTADPNRGDYRQVARFSSLIAAEPEDARAFAEHVLLPDEERGRHRQGEKARYIGAWMEDRPPTAKQPAYLRGLGDSGTVETMLAAHDLIDKLTNQRRGVHDDESDSHRGDPL